MNEPRITFGIESVSRTDGDHVVYPMSLLFRSGDYADKNFRMSNEELKAAVENFSPVAGNIEHTDFLRGRACEVKRVWLSADGATMHGEVSVPRGLDALMEPHERKLSCEWNRDTKQLGGVALCVKPRIPDAALMNEAAEQFTVEEVAEYAAFAGKANVAQTMHDMTVAHGATCGANMAMNATDAMQKMHDVSTTFGATCHANMSEEVPIVVRQIDVKETDMEGTTAVAPATETVSMADFTAMKERDAKREAEFARIAKENRETKADAFIANAIREGHIVPAVAAQFTALHCALAEDDMANEKIVYFSMGDAEFKGTRVKAFETAITQMPKHVLFKEAVAGEPWFQMNPQTEEPDTKKIADAGREQGRKYAEQMNGPKR